MLFLFSVPVLHSDSKGQTVTGGINVCARTSATPCLCQEYLLKKTFQFILICSWYSCITIHTNFHSWHIHAFKSLLYWWFLKALIERNLCIRFHRYLCSQKLWFCLFIISFPFHRKKICSKIYFNNWEVLEVLCQITCNYITFWFWLCLTD